MSPEQVKKLLGNQQEVAFIDVRETADYGRGHPFFVSHVAYSILEAKITLSLLFLFSNQLPIIFSVLP